MVAVRPQEKYLLYKGLPPTINTHVAEILREAVVYERDVSIDVKGPSSEAKATRLRAAVRRRREFTKPTLPVYKTGPQLSLELMDEMMTRGLSPNGFTYGAVINAAAAEGHWERALGLLGTARASGMPLGQSE